MPHSCMPHSFLEPSSSRFAKWRDLLKSSPSLHHLLLDFSQISGKWFYIASAFHSPEYKESVSKYKASFFYLTPNHTEDTLWLREYATM